MKKIILLPVIFLVLQGFSQEPYYNFKKFKESKDSSVFLPLDRLKWKEAIPRDSLARLLKSLQQEQYAHGFGELSLALQNRNKVFYILPQDNMPCIVPDMSQFNMPVLGKKIKIEGMPPGSFRPQPLIPKPD